MSRRQAKLLGEAGETGPLHLKIPLREPLLAPLAALATGILVSRLADFSERELCLILAALSIPTAIAAWRARRMLVPCLLVASVFGGALVDVWHRPPTPPELDAHPQERVILGGCVVEPSVFHEGREQFVLELERGARVRVSLYLREGQKPPLLRYGQTAEIEATVRKPRNFRNPGGFDYASYLARKDIYWTASVRSADDVHVLPERCGERWREAVFALRSSALMRLEKLYESDAYMQAMMQALLIGESTKLERVWTENFRRTGTYHAIVISGLHVTVLAAFLLFLLRVMNLGPSLSLLVTTAAAWLYALVAGWETPVIRAAAGLTLYLAGGFFHRRRRLLNVLAAIAIVFLLIDPEQLFDASFHLSFLSVAAIGALAIPLLERTVTLYSRALSQITDIQRDAGREPRALQFRVELRLLAETLRWCTRIPERWSLAAMSGALRVLFYLVELVAVSAVIQIALALPMAIYFHRVSLSGLTANAIVVPLMSLAVPVGFIAVFSGWSFPAGFAGWLVSTSLRVVEWHIRWEPNWRIPAPPWWIAAAFLVSLVLLATGLRLSRRLAWVGVAGLAAAFSVLVIHPFPPKVTPGSLELTAIDVGQGESLLVGFPDSSLMVVDGGGIPAFGTRRRARLDIGEDVVSTYLWSRSVRRVKTLVATHIHEDHTGGLGALIDNFRPEELWIGATSENPLWDELRRRAEAKNVRIVPLRAGQSLDHGGARIEVLAPAADYVASEKPRNDDSLVLQVSHGRHVFLLTGDAERGSERRMLADGRLGRVDVLKAGHHGSRTSTLDETLEVTRPSLAVISAGYENNYRLPHVDLLARLEARQTAVLRTDLFGLVTVRSDGSRLRADTQRWSAGEQRRLTRRSAF